GAARSPQAGVANAGAGRDAKAPAQASPGASDPAAGADLGECPTVADGSADLSSAATPAAVFFGPRGPSALELAAIGLFAVEFLRLILPRVRRRMAQTLGEPSPGGAMPR